MDASGKNPTDIILERLLDENGFVVKMKDLDHIDLNNFDLTAF